jgi:hypothetical protein
MSFQRRICTAFLVAAASTAFNAHADSFASSASSAGSASSGSVSTSLNASSNSSSGNEKKVANGNFRILDIAAAPGRPQHVRLTMQMDAPDQKITLDLPAAVFEQQELGKGDLVHVQQRAYGYEFAHADTRKPFFLVLEDNWHNELAARPVLM